jgi:hypothetical protein
MGATASQLPGWLPAAVEHATARTSLRVVAADPYGVFALTVSNPSVLDAITVAV